MDKSVDPCVDFYRYACGTWLKQNPVPSDKAVYGRSSELADRNREILRDVLEKASTAGADRSANEQKTGDYYASCMDEAAIESKGIAVLRPELDRITGLKSKDALPALLGRFSLLGYNAFFGFGSEQDAKDSTQQIAVVGKAVSGCLTVTSTLGTIQSQSKFANNMRCTCRTCSNYSVTLRKMLPHIHKS